ncbi:MAG: hypothetical protein ACF8PN_03630 [Phycisphaerales bacterium]
MRRSSGRPRAANRSDVTEVTCEQKVAAPGSARAAVRLLRSARDDYQSGERPRSALTLLDLTRRHPSIASNAWLALAAIQLDEIGVDTARATLRRGFECTSSAEIAIALACLEREALREDSVRSWIRRAFDTPVAWVTPHAVETLVRDAGFDIPATTEETPPPDLIERLANDLVEDESLIRSLVAAASRDERARWPRLLLDAIQACFDRLSNRQMAYEAIGLLAWRLGDLETARDWLARGVREFRWSAPLAMLMTEMPRLTAAESVRWPELADPGSILSGVIARHPTWPDLREARLRLEAA